jgi:hypothetical protein
VKRARRGVERSWLNDELGERAIGLGWDGRGSGVGYRWILLALLDARVLLPIEGVGVAGWMLICGWECRIPLCIEAGRDVDERGKREFGSPETDMEDDDALIFCGVGIREVPSVSIACSIG